MSATTADARTHAKTRKTSLHNQRLWALWGSYAALAVFVVIFLVPPFYTVITSLKSSAEISAQTGSPWIVNHPTLDNFWYLITYPNFQTYYLNSAMITVVTVAVSMTISVAGAASRISRSRSSPLPSGSRTSSNTRWNCCCASNRRASSSVPAVSTE